MDRLHSDIQYLKGIGPERARAFARLGIQSVSQLLYTFPRDYEDRTRVVPLGETVLGDTCSVRLTVVSEPRAYRVRKGMELLKFRAADGAMNCEITYFNQKFLKDKFVPGQEYLFYGKIEGNFITRSMANPAFEPAAEGDAGGSIVPIYRLTAGLSQTVMRKSLREALKVAESEFHDPLPEDLRRDYDLCGSVFALENIHFPTDEKSLTPARRRMVFEEFFLLQLGMFTLKNRRRGQTPVRMSRNVTLDGFLSRLPFSLTGAQRRTLTECVDDLAGDEPMNRLVQGDVGSGKTVVAAGVAYYVVKNGYQAAMMVPTEILATQHFLNLAPLLDRCGIRTAVLTGSQPAATRRSILEQLASGEIDFVIGTHALLGEQVHFSRLGLIVTDEQHRFGVAQRAQLAAKGENPHVLVMSATPIPRTLALIIYGDLDVSVIDELPPGRQEIQTVGIDSSKRTRAYGYIRRELAAGRQAYIVCPLVEESETGDSDLHDVMQYSQTLQREVFPDFRVGFLHGRMKQADKDAIMADFVSNRIQVLVSTTVIEVGVDVKNATVMMIENAERFGLSALHQLRGRVGRGEHKSLCVLVSDSRNEKTVERLRTLCRTNDGFQIAEADLKLRGPGDFFGVRQHGLPALRIADMAGDMRILKEAQEAAADLLRRDPALEAPELLPLREKLEELFALEEGNFLN
ncbi:ATP-dependent DNA helicase RecG [Feifania hominis]|uniref:ATP-dependent DNA helicase RecG n=1 Tax=Feifania hominis TaxID=2763660 RepID=A0A926HQ83_9FIRM|nr:ATP-dependent DNA helicase RecG [Feifania hominis]